MNAFWDFGPVRLVLALAVIAFFGLYFFGLSQWLIRGYVGGGEWGKGIGRSLVSCGFAWLAVVMLQQFAFWLWQTTPGADAYNSVSKQYTNSCAIAIRDDESSWHWEDDWHAGDYVCSTLKRRLHSLHPQPDWLYGTKEVLGD